MDNTVHEFEKFMNEVDPNIRKIEDQFKNKSQAVAQACWNKGAGRETDFVECMIKKQDENTNEFKKFELHLLFWKNMTFSCFESSPKDLSSCKAESKVLLQAYIQKCMRRF